MSRLNWIWEEEVAGEGVVVAVAMASVKLQVNEAKNADVTADLECLVFG